MSFNNSIKSLSIASLIMMSSVFLSRIMGIVREMVLARFGGTSSEMDAYVAAFLLPEIVNHLLAGGFMAITFIPLFQKLLLEKDPQRAWRAFSNILNTGTVILGIILVLCMIFTENLLGLMGSNINNPAQLALATKLTRIILPAQIFFYWGELFMAVQYANKRFFIPALSPLCYNLGIILGGVLLGPKIGIEGFAWGVLGGSFVGSVLLQFIGLRSVSARFLPYVNLRDPDFQRYVLITVPLIIGLGMQFSNEIFFRFFGSFLSEGGMASLNYSLRITMVIYGLFGQAVGIASYPFLSNLAAQNKIKEMNTMSFDVIAKIGILIIPISAVMMVVAPEIITVLFQRGKFTAASTAATAPVLSLYLIGVFAFAANTMLTRSFYALQKTVLPMIVSSLVAAAAIPAYILLSKMMGAPGVALAGSCAAISLTIVLAWFWTARHGDTNTIKRVLLVYAKAVIAAALGAGLCLAVKNGLWMTGIKPILGSLLSNLIVGFTAGGVGLVAAFCVMSLLGITEIWALLKKLLKRKD